MGLEETEELSTMQADNLKPSIPVVKRRVIPLHRRRDYSVSDRLLPGVYAWQLLLLMLVFPKAQNRGICLKQHDVV